MSKEPATFAQHGMAQALSRRLLLGFGCSFVKFGSFASAKEGKGRTKDPSLGDHAFSSL
jgi:hypothetical protein